MVAPSCGTLVEKSINVLAALRLLQATFDVDENKEIVDSCISESNHKSVDTLIKLLMDHMVSQS